MDAMIDKICMFVHTNFRSIILLIISIAFVITGIVMLVEIRDRYAAAVEYIDLLESDAGEDYILDVASSTNAYQNYYNR